MPNPGLSAIRKLSSGQASTSLGHRLRSRLIGMWVWGLTLSRRANRGSMSPTIAIFQEGRQLFCPAHPRTQSRQVARVRDYLRPTPIPIRQISLSEVRRNRTCGRISRWPVRSSKLNSPCGPLCAECGSKNACPMPMVRLFARRLPAG